LFRRVGLFGSCLHLKIIHTICRNVLNPGSSHNQCISGFNLAPLSPREGSENKFNKFRWRSPFSEARKIRPADCPACFESWRTFPSDLGFLISNRFAKFPSAAKANNLGLKRAKHSFFYCTPFPCGGGGRGYMPFLTIFISRDSTNHKIPSPYLGCLRSALPLSAKKPEDSGQRSEGSPTETTDKPGV